MTGSNSCGVVIVTFNSAPEIADCLASVRAATTRPVTIVVVDNASTDSTCAIVSQSFPDVRLITNTTNRYYAAASNQGLAAVSDHYILLLNPDAVLPVGGLDALAQQLDDDTNISAIAPQLIGPDGQPQPSVRELPGLDTLWYDLTGLAFLLPRSRIFGRWRMTYFDHRETQFIEQPMASCLLIRRSAFTEVGSFDERYPMFFNDVDWCRRLKEHGGRILYTPSVRVRHVGGASIARHKVKMIWMGHLGFFRYLLSLYSKRPVRRLLVVASAPFLFGAAILRSLWWGVFGRLFQQESSSAQEDH